MHPPSTTPLMDYLLAALGLAVVCIIAGLLFLLARASL